MLKVGYQRVSRFVNTVLSCTERIKPATETEREQEVKKEGQTYKHKRSKENNKKKVWKERRTSAGKYEKQTQKRRGRKRQQNIKLAK